MNILIASDKNYLQYAYVMLVSLLENNPNDHIDLYYIHYDLDDTSIEKFKRFFSKYDMAATFLKYDFSRIEMLKTCSHIARATYLKIICADVLPEEIHRVIYLDPDIIVTKSLADLYTTDLRDFFLGAVVEYDWDNERHMALNIPNEYKLFNAGVMLIDLEKFRSHGVSKRVMSYAVEHRDRILFGDQCAFNAVLYNKWLALHPRWNVSGWITGLSNDKSHQVPEEIAAALSDPAVIHYNGGIILLGGLNDHPFKVQYRHYLRKTPFRYSIPLGGWYRHNRLKIKTRAAFLMRKSIIRLPKRVQKALPHGLTHRLGITNSERS
jgi:lipopolysaccharide biosynthesis glycosyltransferase